MGYIEVIGIAIALSMDAFAVSVCKGLSLKKMDILKALLCGAYFGGFQAAMPLFGYLFGNTFADVVRSYGTWIACIVLIIIGGKMISDAFSKKEEEINPKFDYKTMVMLAIATSIDALMVGVTFSFTGVALLSVLIYIAIIGATTFVFSFAGVGIGQMFGSKFEKKAEVVGGIILILIGLKLVLEMYL